MHQNERSDYESFIAFTCPTCGAENQDVIGVLGERDTAQTHEDGVSEQEQTYVCGRCLHSYKLLVRSLGSRIVVKIVDHPSVDVEASDAYWTEESEFFETTPWDIPEEPFGILRNTITDVLEVIRSPHAEFFSKTLPRMAFIQLFAAIEAFLTDTLLTRVLDDKERLSRVLTGVKDLQAIKLPLSDILANPDIVKHTVAATVHKMSFHNFTKTDAIWNIAFGHSIFKSDEVKERLLKYAAIRHDCVHRNGKSEDGKERLEVDFDFVREVAKYFEATALHIEGQFDGIDFGDGLFDENTPDF